MHSHILFLSFFPLNFFGYIKLYYSNICNLISKGDEVANENLGKRILMMLKHYISNKSKKVIFSKNISDDSISHKNFFLSQKVNNKNFISQIYFKFNKKGQINLIIYLTTTWNLQWVHKIFDWNTSYHSTCNNINPL